MPCRFLSTPSARRATAVHIGSELCHDISIHALREEGDPPPDFGLITIPIFLSTPSARRATQHSLATVIHIRISIHALREEGDALRTPTITTTSDFYPRPPRGGRQGRNIGLQEAIQFLSTPSARRATPSGYGRVEPSEFLSTPSARRATLSGQRP